MEKFIRRCRDGRLETISVSSSTGRLLASERASEQDRTAPERARKRVRINGIAKENTRGQYLHAAKRAPAIARPTDWTRYSRVIFGRFRQRFYNYAANDALKMSCWSHTCRTRKRDRTFWKAPGLNNETMAT